MAAIQEEEDPFQGESKEGSSDLPLKDEEDSEALMK